MASIAFREVQTIDREVSELLREIEDQIQRIEHKLVESAPDAQREVGVKITHCKSRVKTMEIELRTIMELDEAKRFRPMIKQHRQRLKECSDALKWTQAGAADENNRTGYNVDEILKDENAAAADRTIIDLTQTQEAAVDTATKLHDQTEQIANVDRNLAEIEDEIDRASRVLRRMGRRVLTDKYLWCMIFMIFSAVIAIVVVGAVRGTVTRTDQRPNFRRRLFAEMNFLGLD